MSVQSELKSKLTPELNSLMVTTFINAPKNGPIDFRQYITDMFANDPNVDALRPKVWPALKALSEIELSHMPDMMNFLPPVEDPEFPEQALGLLLLLDQGPRAFCKSGTDVRYTDSFFAEISIKLARHIMQELPEAERPSQWSRWEGKVSAEYFVLAREMYGAIFVHYEGAKNEARAFTEETRVWVEERFNARDPYRDGSDLMKGLYGFPDMVKAMISGMIPARKEGEDQTMNAAEGWFFLALLMDVHYPLLDNFGRYPYRNGAMGRLHTAQEKSWMKGQDFFHELPEDTVIKIRQDVEAGRWTPLGS